jgi:DNA repair protein RecO (recombination protein O)
MEVKVNALMLRAIDYRENDKILTLLTAETGKITAGIKGVKKSGAKLKFAAQPFCFAEYILSKTGERYTVIQASEIESFYDLRTDINKFYAASAVCEGALAATYEGEDSGRIFYECIHAITDMCNNDESDALIKFLLNLLSICGYGLGLDNCVECGQVLTSQDKMRFDMNSGSFTCWDCGNGTGASGVTYNVLRKAAEKSFDQSCITPDGKKRALRLLREYLTYKTDAKLLSLSEYIRLL